MRSPVPSCPNASALLTPCSCGPALLACPALLMPRLLVALICGNYPSCLLPAPCTRQLWTSNWGYDKARASIWCAAPNSVLVQRWIALFTRHPANGCYGAMAPITHPAPCRHPPCFQAKPFGVGYPVPRPSPAARAGRSRHPGGDVAGAGGRSERGVPCCDVLRCAALRCAALRCAVTCSTAAIVLDQGHLAGKRSG